MSIQRWTFINGAEPHWLEEHPKGEYVTYADHVAAVAAAEQRGYGRGLDLDYDDRIKAAFDYGREYQQQRLTSHDMHSGLACLTNYERGVKAAREAVAALIVGKASEEYINGVDDALAAIDALEKP